MKDYAPDKIRNIALVGHSGTGKTSLAEALLFVAGATTRLGTIEQGSTISDWDPDEQKREFSLNLSILPLEWNDHKINIIDNPGYMDFMGEVKCGLRAVDVAVITIDAVSGVQVGTEFVTRFADELDLPSVVVINRMDRDNADFSSALSQAQELIGSKCIALQIPIGSQQDFAGVIDLLTMKAYMGEKADEADIPADMADEAESLREKMIEAAAETDDALITKYLEGEELSPDELANGLRAGILSGKVVPALATSATNMIGVRRLADTITSLCPSPADRVANVDGKEIPADPSQPLTALVFKTTADPYVGRLTYFRVLSGSFASDSHVWNPNRNATERVGAVYRITGKDQEQVTAVNAGDIGAVAKLAETQTGDTLGDKESPVTLPQISFPAPSFSAAISPKTKADLDKMGTALARIVEEDPSLKLERNASTSETILSGLGDSHVEVALEKIKRKFSVELESAKPRVPYQETVQSSAEAEYTHKKQTGGHGQYARVALRVEPKPRGSGFEFVNETVGGVVPKQYVGSVEKGVLEALQDGILAHFPVVDLKVTLYDGREHPVDSSDIAFKIASSMAFKQGAQDARPTLLEPIMDMQITVPEQNTGDVISDLNGKRARVQGMTPMGSMTMIEAQAPLAEVQHYSADMRSITQGRGFYSMSFSHYEGVPTHVSQKVVEEAEKAHEAARS
ncbi:MAG: elongation factor G [Chloroflexi bacterium]|nr:elongation factor G [Chloroflexota bacterium]